MVQILVNDIVHTHLVPMKAKSEAGHALQWFDHNVGIPSVIHTDDTKEFTMGKWKYVCSTHIIKQTQTEPYSPF
jgi:hypothetical protein